MSHGPSGVKAKGTLVAVLFFRSFFSDQIVLSFPSFLVPDLPPLSFPPLSLHLLVPVPPSLHLSSLLISRLHLSVSSVLLYLLESLVG